MKKIFLIAIISIVSANFVHAGALTDDYIDIATSFIQNGKYQQALIYINKAISFDSQNNTLLEMQNNLLKITNNKVNLTTNYATNQTFIDAEKFKAQKDYHKAITIYNKCINETPNFMPAYLGLAISLYETKNFQQAKHYLNIYLEKEPKSDFAYMLRAKTNLNLGEGQSALRDIKSADTLFSNPEYKLTEAVILTESGKYSQAKEILMKLSDELQIYIVFRYLGICDYHLGNYKNAVLNFDRAIILFEDDKTILPMYNEAKRRSNES